MSDDKTIREMSDDVEFFSDPNNPFKDSVAKLTSAHTDQIYKTFMRMQSQEEVNHKFADAIEVLAAEVVRLRDIAKELDSYKEAVRLLSKGYDA